MFVVALPIHPRSGVLGTFNEVFISKGVDGTLNWTVHSRKALRFENEADAKRAIEEAFNPNRIAAFPEAKPQNKINAQIRSIEQQSSQKETIS